METHGCLCQASLHTRFSSKTLTYLVGGLVLILSTVAGEPTTTASDLPQPQVTTTQPSHGGKSLDALKTWGNIPDSDSQWSISYAEKPTYWRDGAVCRAGIDNAYTFKVGNAVENLEWLKQCSIIEGNLEIQWMFNKVSPQNYTGMSFPNLIEISGYLLFYRVNGLENLGKLFPGLRVIRAKEEFWDYGLVLYENEDLMSITLPKLAYIGSNVVAMKNPQLCYVDDHVNWLNLTPEGTKPTTTRNKNKKGCDLVDGCKPGCEYCWDMNTCQNDCERCMLGEGKQRYNPGCDNAGRCCHKNCLGGCDAPNDPSACYACKDIYHDGQCMESCPAENEYNETLLELEGRRCITMQDCVDDDWFHKFHDHKCVRYCPPPRWIANKDLTPDNADDLDLHHCVRCTGVCDRVCPGGTIQTASGSKRFEDCTIIDGFLEIAISSTPGNLTLLDENLANIREVKNYVKVVRSKFIQSLRFLKNLKLIRGERLDGNKYAFYVMDNEALESLWDFTTHPVLTLITGSMFFQQNPMLCYSKIRYLLDTTIFNGTLEVRNETGTVIIPITNATHDKYDVSDETNGQYGNCFNNSLHFELFYKFEFFPNYNFSEFNTSDTRVIISYIIYYREVGPNEVASYYKSSCNSNETEWTTLEIEKTESTTQPGGEDGLRYYEGFIPGMLSFTRYAAYVQTYTTKAVGLDGARSQIIYFTTRPSKPDRPRDIEVTPITVGGGNIALDVKWDPPESPNGIIEFYNIYYREVPWRIDHVLRKDHCKHEAEEISKIEEDEKEEEVTAATTVASSNSTANGQCACKEEEPKPSKTKKDELAALLYHFENYLQNKVFLKNPEKTNGGNTRKKRGIGENPADADLANESADMTTSVITSYMTVMTNQSNTTTASPTTAPQPELDDIIAPRVASMARVSANLTSAIIFDLKPNTEYSIEVVACHAFDKETNKTRCSKRAMSTATTKPDPSLDVINSSTVNVTEVPNKKELNFTWTPPEKTNGPILTYTISYRIVDSSNDSDDNITSGDNEFCVQAKIFSNNSNSYVWKYAHLKEGSEYAFRVRMRTVGTPAGNYTEPFKLQVGTAPNEPLVQDSNDVLVKVIPALVVSLVVLTVIIGILIYKRKKQKPLPLTTLHNSFNSEYLDTENIYIPDEWELDRAKVKIGTSLGQGSFGMVYEGEARDLYNTDKKSRKVAIKTVNDNANLQDRINFLNEASRMKAFKCNHIVQLLGVVSQGQPVLVIMELMALGDLKNYLRMHRPDEPDNDGRKPPTLREILQMAAEIADGMAYLSDRKFVHRDLAARNCMVAQDMTVKIGDFGMTRDVYGADYYRKGGKGMLPVRWMAPESLRDGVYTSKSDVWSYGVVLWEMATLAAQPYQGFSNEEVLKFVMENARVMEMPDGCPARLFDMMSKCWQYWPRHRPSFASLLESLQGDVKKTFFSVSWYYSQRDDEDDAESDNLNIDDRHSESEPLHPGSSHSESSVHNMDMDDDELDDDEDDLASAGTANIKDLMIDLRPPVPMRMGKHGQAVADEYALTPNGLTNGQHTSSSEDIDSEDLSLHQYPFSVIPNGGINTTGEGHSRAPSSIVSAGRPPPSYNTATLDQSIGAVDSSVWSADASSTKPNSCNGSANGHLHFGTNTLTSAC